MIAQVTDTMVGIEGEELRGITWVVIEEVRSGDWGIGGNGSGAPPTCSRCRAARRCRSADEPRPRVHLLGRPEVEALGDGRRQVDAQPRGRKSWAVLARIALAERPLLRRELAEELFEQADDPLAALRWSLADLRRGLALPDGLRGDPLTSTGSSCGSTCGRSRTARWPP